MKLKLTIKILSPEGTPIVEDSFSDWQAGIPQIGQSISYEDQVDAKVYKAIIKDVDWRFSLAGLEGIDITCWQK